MVLRLAVASKDFRETGHVSPEVFALSTEDRREDPPRLSVWAERLTRPEQAWRLMGEKSSYRLIVRLSVDAVRTLRPSPEIPAVPDLDVQWHPLRNDDGSPDMRPGADGHAGIVGLHAGSPAQRKSWRRRLDRLVSQDVRWLRQDPAGTTSPPESSP
jgi:hypothetical protein